MVLRSKIPACGGQAGEEFCAAARAPSDAMRFCAANSDAEDRNVPVASLMAATGAFFSSVPKIHKQGCAFGICAPRQGVFIRLPRTRTHLSPSLGTFPAQPLPRGPRRFPSALLRGRLRQVPGKFQQLVHFRFAEGQLFIVHHKARHAHHLIFLTQSRKMV